ncbi:MAG: ABC transporter permease [Myxococcota bacterium]|nr:ABC transporter permease [Myxococcota bacterium]
MGRRWVATPAFGAAAGCALVFAFFAIFAADSGMWSARGIVNFLEVSALLGILAAPVALLMIGGEFDLSVGSMVGAVSIAIAIPAMEWGWPLGPSIALGFAFAAAWGGLNGIVVVRSGLPSFIVTLASLFVLRGLALGVTRWATGRTQIGGLKEPLATASVAPLFSGEVAEPLFSALADAGWMATRVDGAPAVTGLPVSILWWVAAVALGAFVLFRTRFGNWVLAAGGDARAALRCGVPVDRVKIALFVATAASAALVATLQVLDAGSADTNRGLQKEFEAITAAVIGGCLLSGGHGSILGAGLGALLFGTVQMGLFYTGVDSDWFQVFLGAMLLGAVGFNRFVRGRALA